MCRLFLYFCFLVYLFFPLSGMAQFPWHDDEFKTDETEFYKLQINTHTMKFFNEDELHYFAGTEINIQQPVFDIKASYTYSINEDHHYFSPI